MGFGTGFCDKRGRMAGGGPILIGRNLPNLWLVNPHREAHHPSTAWAAVSARIRRRSTETCGLDLAVAWIATTCQYVSLGQGLPVKAGSPIPMALGLLPFRGRRT